MLLYKWNAANVQAENTHKNTLIQEWLSFKAD